MNTCLNTSIKIMFFFATCKIDCLNLWNQFVPDNTDGYFSAFTGTRNYFMICLNGAMTSWAFDRKQKAVYQNKSW